VRLFPKVLAGPDALRAFRAKVAELGARVPVDPPVDGRRAMIHFRATLAFDVPLFHVDQGEPFRPTAEEANVGK